MKQMLDTVHGVVWGPPVLMLILGSGIYLSIRTGFVQFRFFPRALKAFGRRLLGRDPADGATSFQALCTALAATVGTGNLAGVAGAIAIGGPGAIFWMWVCALLGMGVKYAEATLAVRFQVLSSDGLRAGGPMHMIAGGLGKHWRFLAWIYAFFGVVAAFGVGNCTQINAVVTGIHSVLPVLSQWSASNLIIGLGLAVLVVSMLLGGARRIGTVAEHLVPLAAGIYILLGLGILILRLDRIPEAFYRIIAGAFTPAGVTGGLIGSWMQVLRIGISRGIFTNEAGMGTASIAHGGAKVSHPGEQGLMGIMEVFLDTIVICTMTALVILVSDVSIPYGYDEGLGLTIRAFSEVYGDWVSVLITLETGCFAFATVLGWGLYGARCAEYLFGPGAWKYFSWLQGLTVIAGAVLNTGIVWKISEITNGLMTIPNLIALVLLTPELVRLTKTFSAGNSYNF